MKNKLFLFGLLALSVFSNTFTMYNSDFEYDCDETELQDFKKLKTGFVGTVSLLHRLVTVYSMLSVPEFIEQIYDTPEMKQSLQQHNFNCTCHKLYSYTVIFLYYQLTFWLIDTYKQLDTLIDPEVHYYKSKKKWWVQRRLEEFKKDVEGLRWFYF